MLGLAAILISLGAIVHSSHPLDGSILRAGVVLLVLGAVCYAVSFLWWAATHFYPPLRHDERLLIECGNSGPFDKPWVMPLPSEFGNAIASHRKTFHEDPGDQWFRMSKTVKVTNRSKSKAAVGCQIHVSEITPHEVTDDLPASLLWQTTRQPSFDLAPQTSAYAIIWEIFMSAGDNKTLAFSQKPLTSPTINPEVTMRLVAWADGFRPATFSLRLTGLLSGEYPVADEVTQEGIRTMIWGNSRRLADRFLGKPLSCSPCS